MEFNSWGEKLDLDVSCNEAETVMVFRYVAKPATSHQLHLPPDSVLQPVMKHPSASKESHHWR